MMNLPLPIVRAFDEFSEKIADHLRPGTQIVISVRHGLEDVPPGSALRVIIGDRVLANEEDAR